MSAHDDMTLARRPVPVVRGSDDVQLSLGFLSGVGLQIFPPPLWPGPRAVSMSVCYPFLLYSRVSHHHQHLPRILLCVAVVGPRAPLPIPACATRVFLFPLPSPVIVFTTGGRWCCDVPALFCVFPFSSHHPPPPSVSALLPPDSFRAAWLCGGGYCAFAGC